MAITRTARGSGQVVAATPHNITLSSAPPNGDWVVLKIVLKTGATNQVNSISGLGATWTKIVAGWRASTNSRAEIWRGQVVTSGTAVTITPSTSLAMGWEAESYNFSAGTATFTALTGEGVGNADEVSNTTYHLTGITSGSVVQTINPTTATNVVTGVCSIGSTAANSFSSLTAGWTQSVALGGSATLHPFYTYWQQNTPTSAQSVQVTGTATGFLGNAIVQVSETIAAATAPPPWETFRRRNNVNVRR